MKKRVLWLRYLVLVLGIAFGSAVYAQDLTITGTVTDAADGSSIPGVTVAVKNTTAGTVTDVDGKYSVKVNPGAILVFSYVGYTTQEVTIKDQKSVNISLSASVSSLNEVVVIGYGTVRKQDATGSVTAIDKKSFNQGAIASPQQLIIGKIPGVNVTTYGGAPGGDAVIRIRGGSSLSSSNDPLIVIDGVPVDNSSTSGSRGTLSMINPDDIETYTVLKDASATAIYGSRASNGVILITTKKGVPGSKKFGLEYSGNVSLATVPKTISVLGADEYRALVKQRYAGNSAVLGLLDTIHSTDWQKEIFKSAISTDHNLAFSGAISTMPYRLSVGYMYQNGVLETDNMQKTSIGLNLNPTFFQNYLKVTANAKLLFEKNHWADQGAIGAAIAFDPTKPVNADNRFGGYYAWLQQPGDTLPVAQATSNPVALLKLRDNNSNVTRFIGNLQLDYKLHFFPDLRAVLNLGIDYSKGKGTDYTPEYASWVYSSKGIDNTYSQTKNNKVLDFYLNYVKEVKSIKSKFDVMAGYSWEHFYYEQNNNNSNIPHDSALTSDVTQKKEYFLVSFYGRLNYTLAKRYLLTVTVRDDGSSKYQKATRWGLFPSLALGWKINDEKFLRDVDWLSQLKLRLGWGKTGQQDFGANWYPSLATYTQSNQYAQYQFGDYWYYTMRANAYDANAKWETTTTYNVGVDFGFWDDRINGSIDYYIRNTSDLLVYSPVPAGTNLSNWVWTNIGDMQNKGWEFGLNMIPVVTKDWKWELNLNAATNKNEITKLTVTDDPNYAGIATGGISGGVGNTVQMQSVGYAVNSFYVFQQVYDANGKPIEGLYVDRNADGKITDADRYHYKSATATSTYGISTSLSYKKWTLSAAGHAAVGNYVYNNVSSNRGVYSNLYRPEGPYLGNVTSDVFDVDFEQPQYLSDYYVQNGSFFKLDYLSLGYDFGNIVKNTAHLRLTFTVNNLFTITNYKGIDPEVYNGIDNNLYPRSRIFVLGVNLAL